MQDLAEIADAVMSLESGEDGWDLRDAVLALIEVAKEQQAKIKKLEIALDINGIYGDHGGGPR